MSAKLKYVLPSYLQGTMTQGKYSRWLSNETSSLLAHDKIRKLPCAFCNQKHDYEQALHTAVCNNGLKDPYTGETLRWDLLSILSPAKMKALRLRKKTLGVSKEDALLPSVDHKDPASPVLDFEICALRTNTCKSYLTPSEFIAFCKQVAEFTKNRG
jgi:hypothetical protein